MNITLIIKKDRHFLKADIKISIIKLLKREKRAQREVLTRNQECGSSELQT